MEEAAGRCCWGSLGGIYGLSLHFTCLGAWSAWPSESLVLASMVRSIVCVSFEQRFLEGVVRGVFAIGKKRGPTGTIAAHAFRGRVSSTTFVNYRDTSAAA